MWSGLGIDLEAHDALLGALGKAYGEVYLTQEGRPRGMEYFDFVMSEIHGLRIAELLEAKRAGRKVIGTFCLYVPEEILLAADAIAVGLCAGAEMGTAEAEQVLPRNTCALIKSFFGFKLTHVCPYVEACDFVIGETTCDGKTKAWEIFDEYKPTFVLEVPHTKSDAARTLWRSELDRLVDKIEKEAGRKIGVEDLRRGVAIANAKRGALQRLSRLRAAPLAPISGRDGLLVNQVAFYDDPIRFTEKVNALCDEIEVRMREGRGVAKADAPRILLSGCPMSAPNWKVPFLIEKSGAVIVGEESCVGERGTWNLVDEGGATREEILDRIAERYLAIDCAVFSPNRERPANVVEMARRLGADGVIHYGLQFCTPYIMEARKVQQALEQEKIPMLRLETDYSMEDAPQLETRIQAFLEILR
ncbi:MAG: double-cubane-cluster-containing anaerobic reductase [Candidatus Eisenbacteria bacterium]|nr:double-cubane-cluster-containing anaerobic reductase [Candidatus Eisenbacteria bacterium]